MHILPLWKYLCQHHEEKFGSFPLDEATIFIFCGLDVPILSFRICDLINSSVFIWNPFAPPQQDYTH